MSALLSCEKINLFGNTRCVVLCTAALRNERGGLVSPGSSSQVRIPLCMDVQHPHVISRALCRADCGFPTWVTQGAGRHWRAGETLLPSGDKTSELPLAECPVLDSWHLLECQSSGVCYKSCFSLPGPHGHLSPALATRTWSGFCRERVLSRCGPRSPPLFC